LVSNTRPACRLKFRLTCLLATVFAPILAAPNLLIAQEQTSPGTDFGAFELWLEGEINTRGIPGVAMGIVTADEVLDVQTWGVRSRDGEAPVDAQTVFRIASVSKTFAGAVAALLVHDRKQQWDTPLITVLPQYHIGTEPASKDMTLRHVLSHTTGLMPHAYSNMLDAGVAYDKIQEKFQEIPTVCPPGRCYGYQNVVFSLVSDVVEASEHQTYEEFVQARILTPLGMKNASLGLEGYAGRDNVSAPHQFGGEHWRVATTNAAYYTVGPAAGVNASVEDMMLWAQANLGAFPAVLPPEVLKEQHAPVVETPSGNYFNRWPRLEKAWYGLGWRVFDYAGRRVIHHGGGVRGFRSEVVLVPELDIAMVVLFNAETPVANDVVPMFLDTVMPTDAKDAP
jgi:beta-lactamase class C